MTSRLIIDDAAQKRLHDVYARYRMQYEQPDRCRPMIIINTPLPNLPVWEERLADPMVMLKAELDAIQPHLEIGDDRVPSIRVQFGTAQIAAAFGCEMFLPENNLPAAGSHVLANATPAEIAQLEIPPLDAGWYGKLTQWTDIWRQNIPEGVYFQHPDIQSAFNSAHLIRGNDIFMDFYDQPELVGILMDKVTDFMVAMIRHMKSMFPHDPEWFFDWGAMWKGAGRISNCSMQMISPELYVEHVLPRDIRFFETIGGGRMHYCGTAGRVIDEFFKLPCITGLDVDFNLHDFYEICARAPQRVALIPTISMEIESPMVRRLLQGDWPKKRNITVAVNAPSLEEGKRLYDQLQRSIPY